jgi:hypothetical protein
VLRMRPRPRSACRGDHSETLTLLTWPDTLVRIAEPGPASLIQVGSDAKTRGGCHLIVTFCSNEHTKNAWSLGDSNL